MRSYAFAVGLVLGAGCGDDAGPAASGGETESTGTGEATASSAAGSASGTSSASGSATSTSTSTGPSTQGSDTETDGMDAGSSGVPGDPWDCPPPVAPPTCDPNNAATPPFYAASPTVYDVGSLAANLDSVYVADLEGDGDLDVITPHIGGISLLRNDGEANFELLRASEQIFSPSWTTVGDFDGDCMADVLYRDAVEPGVEALWLQRGGPDGFSEPEEITIAGVDVDSMTAIGGPYHFNDDGAPDLLIEVDSTGWIALHDAQGVGFSVGDPLPFALRLSGRQGPIDFDADGEAREVRCQATSPDNWDGVCRIGAGEIVLPPGQTVTEELFVGYDHTRTGDIDGDGGLDKINAPNTQDYMFVQRLDPKTLLFDDQEGSYPVGNDALIADLDLDCDADVVGTLLEISVPPPILFSYSAGGPSWPVTEQYEQTMSFDAVAAADFDGDGDIDLILAENSDMAVLLSSQAP